MQKGKTEAPKTKRNSVIALIDLSKDDESQYKVIKSAARIAEKRALDLKLYPKYDGSKSFTELRRMVDMQNEAKTICNQQVSVVEKKFNLLNLFPSINKIAEKQNAEIIITGTCPEFMEKDMWRIINNSKFPVLLLPDDFEIVHINRIAIAIDMDRNIQKIGMVSLIAKAFHAGVDVFIERPKNGTQEAILSNILSYFAKVLIKSKISFLPITVRKATKFITRYCKYCAKHVDIAAMEVVQDNINEEIKQNIITLLSLPKPKKKGEAEPTPILLVKTEVNGRFSGFNG